MTRPLRSTPITTLHRYYKTVRPCAPPPVLNPSGLITPWKPGHPAPLEVSLSPQQITGDTFETTGSRVPRKSPDQARATYMPDAARAVNRYPPDASQSQDQTPVLTPTELSTRPQWFAHARLPDPHLTQSHHAVSASLTTPALNRRSMRWFEAIPCRTTPEDLPPSPAQLRTARTVR